MMGAWRKLHNEELCDLYSSPSVTEDEMGRVCGVNEGEEERV
jgi:hypothetical protein